MFKGSFNNLKKVKWTYIVYKNSKQAEVNYNNLKRIKNLDHIEMKLDSNYIKLLSDNIIYLKFEQEKFGKSSIQTLYSEL